MYRILIADDEKDERDVIVYLLGKYHVAFDILQAANGRDAMAVLPEEPVDVLITDIKMPFCSGIELAAKARSLNPDIEILFFSGYDDFEYVKTALSLHAVNYILKPVNPEEFLKTISGIIDTLSARDSMKAEQYVERHFFPENQTGMERPSGKDGVISEQDNRLMKNIEQSIRNKNPELLKRNVCDILNKYESAPNASHAYIRYLGVTLVRLLRNAFPAPVKDDFRQLAEEICVARDYSHIRIPIEGLLRDAIMQINQAGQYPKHAIQLVERYIHAHYGDALNLDLLADTVYLSPKYLSSMFIRVTGTGLSRYIRKVRMEKARELLLTTNMKIADVCKGVGHTNESYFCKTFQQSFGLTPDKFRQNKGGIE